MKDSNWKQSLTFRIQPPQTKIADLYNTLSKKKARLEASRIKETNLRKDKTNQRIYALKRYKKIEEDKISRTCPEVLPLLEQAHKLKKQINPEIIAIDKKIANLQKQSLSFDELFLEIKPLLDKRKQLEDTQTNPELEQIEAEIQNYCTIYPEIESSIKNILSHNEKIDSKQKEKGFNTLTTDTPNLRDLHNALYLNDLKLATIKYKVLTSPAQERAYQTSPNPSENHTIIQKNIEHLKTFFKKANVSPSAYEEGNFSPTSNFYEKEVAKIAKLIKNAPITQETLTKIEEIDLNKIYEIQNNILSSPPSSFTRED